MHVEKELHVVFGMGPAGAALARSLVGRGMRVRLVSRNGIRRADLPAAAEVLAADVTDLDQARSACDGAAVVYQCVNAPYHQWPELFPRLQTGILRAAEASGARLVALENLYMYGAVKGSLTEDLPYRATTRKGRVRAAMAEELIQAHERGRVSVAIGRAADFYGPGVRESSLGAMVFRPLLEGKTVWTLGNPEALHSYAYIEDVGSGLATLGMNRNACGRVWHLPHAEAVSTRQVLEMAASEAGRALTARSLGSFGLRVGGLFSPSTREMVEMMYQFEESFVVDDTLYRQTFEERATPLRVGLHETLRWYRTQLQHAV